MTPSEALETQISMYRAMTGEQRLGIALGLHALSCEMARECNRAQHPNASPGEVESLLHERLALARKP